MELKDTLKMKGALTLELIKENGDIEVRQKNNIIVDVGFDFIADAIGNATRPAAMGFIAVGTGSTAPVAANTTLETELVRQAATYSHIAGTKEFQVQTTLSSGVGTGALTEAGVFNDVAAGTMFDRVTFAAINKQAGDTLIATFTFTMA